MRIATTGNVGIGTTSPLGKLQVNEYTVASQGAQSVHGELSVFTNSGDESLFLGIKDAAYPNRGWALNPVANGVNADLQIKEHGPTGVRMTLQTGGNVGIGTTSPEAKLTIKGDALNTDQPVRITNSATDTHTGLFLNNTGSAVGEKYGMQFGGYNQYSIGGIFGVLDSVSGSTSGDITFDLGNGTSAGSLIERMRITHEGNVGIGTSSPGAKLDVSVSTAGDYAALINNTNSTNGYGLLARTASTGTSSYAFAARAGSSDIFVVRADGNVGIGTTSPAYKLDINGDFRVKDGSSAIAFNEYSNGATIWLDGSNGDFAGGDYFNISAYGTTDLAFGYAAGTKITMKSDGKLGIGTTSPGYKLTSYSSGDEFAIVAGAGNAVGEFTGIGLSGYIATNAAVKAGLVFERETSWGIGKMHFLNNNTLGDSDATLSDSKMTIDSSGNVGIGTTSPFGTTANRTCLSVNGSTDVSLNIGTGGVQKAYLYSEGNYARLATIGSIPLTLGVDDTEKMRIDSTGNVGIGTVSPTEKLQVYEGGLTAYKSYTTTNAGAILTAYQSTFSPFTKTTDLVAGSDGTVPSEIRFLTRTSGTSTIDERVRITSTGNVGIGTTSPDSKLQVDGGIQMADDTDTASADKVGTMRYRTDTEYVEVDGEELVTNGGFVLIVIGLSTGVINKWRYANY